MKVLESDSYESVEAVPVKATRGRGRGRGAREATASSGRGRAAAKVHLRQEEEFQESNVTMEDLVGELDSGMRGLVKGKEHGRVVSTNTSP
jgi:hypothetical protein